LEEAPPFPTQPENHAVPPSCRSPRADRRISLQQGEPECFATCVISLCHLTGESTDAQKITLTFRDRDRTPCIQEIERVRGLEHLLIRRQSQLRRQQLLAHLLVIIEVPQQHRHVSQLEVVS